jgi:hypothetical protein
VLRVKETVVLFPEAEQIIEVNSVGAEMAEGECLLVESIPKCQEKYGIQVAASLISREAKQSVVRILNPLAEEVTLYKGTRIAEAHPVQVLSVLDKEDEADHNQEMTVRYLRDFKSNSQGPSESIKKLEQEDSNPDLPDIPIHLRDLYEKSTQNIQSREKHLVKDLFWKFKDVFQTDKMDIGKLNSQFGEHEIPTGNAAPVRQRPRRTPMAFRGEEEAEIKKMKEMQVIRSSTSPWASPVVLVRKKDNTCRFCVDYTKLNKLIFRENWPLPRIDDCLESLAGAEYFSSMDLASGYWQVPVKEEDKAKTAFVTKSGQYEFNVLPFGLNNAPSTFERIMEAVLRGCQWKTCLIYLDDIIVFGRNLQEQVQRLGEVLEKLQNAGLKLKPSKCNFFQKSLVFLGHLVTSEGLTTDPEKVKALQEWPRPKNVKDVRAFLGFCSYYRRYVAGFAELSIPLCKLTQKQQKFLWSEDCETAFQSLKKALMESPVLAYPQDEGMFILDTDASDHAIGAVLTQLQVPSSDFDKWTERQKSTLEKKFHQEEKVISYASRSLTKEERNYCVTRKELLAVMTFVKYYRHFLLGRKFLIRSDHRPLKWLFHLQDPTGQIARWQETLARYDFDLEYRPGNQHSNADGMSRRPEEELKPPCGGCKKCQRQEISSESVNAVKTRAKTKEETKRNEVTHEKDERISPEIFKNWKYQYSKEEIHDKQMSDSHIAPIMVWISEKSKKPTTEEIKIESQETKNLWLQWDMLLLEKGMLFIRGRSPGNLRLILPAELQREVMGIAHDSMLSGHLGVRKTLHKIHHRFYWYKMREAVEEYIAACQVCSKNKKSRRKNQAPYSKIPVGAPMDHIATDLFGPLPESRNGNKYILLLTDLFSKWTEIIAIPNTTAETCARTILNEFIARFGCPLAIHSDQGRNYESEIFRELCRMLEIRKTRTSARHPQGNGCVERFNQTLVTMIRAYMKGKPSSWEYWQVHTEHQYMNPLTSHQIESCLAEK